MKRYFIFLGVFILILILIGIIAKKQKRNTDPENWLSLITYNIDNNNTELEKIYNLIKSMGIPDVLFLQEVPGEFAASTLAKNLKLPYLVYSNYKGFKVGLAIISRKPILSHKTYYFKESFCGYAALATELMINKKRLLICSVHLDREHQIRSDGHLSWYTALHFIKKELFEENVRSRSVDELLVWIDQFQSDCIILGGDFNTFPLSRPIRKMSEKFKDALWPSMHYFTETYRGLAFPLKPRIDFLFHSPAIRCCKATVIKKGPSDHYPVKAVFSLNG